MTGLVLVNRERGEAVVVLDGEPRRLRLTFGALAEIEAALGATGLADLGERLARLGARELMLVLAALLRGGGEEEAARRLPETGLDAAAAARAVADAFGGAFGRTPG